MSGDIDLLRVAEVTERQDLPAGGFSSWLRRTRSAQVNEHGVDVPCGECNACCRSSYFINIGPGETEALARIPKELLFAAPGLPEGNVVLGYDEKGHCPMLVDDACSIYEHRPLTCRNYDCRIFPAAGIALEEDDKALIAQRAVRWKFSYPSKRDRDQHSAVRAAAKLLRERGECFTGGVPNNPTQLAILAIKTYEVFLGYQDEHGKAGRGPPDLEIAKAVREANGKIEARRYDVD